MKVYKRIALILAICLSSIGCDQVTKAMAAEYLPRGETYSFLKDTLRVGYTENRGAFLSIGSGLTPEMRFWILVVGVGAFLFGLAAYLSLSRGLTRMSVVGCSLVLSGGLSNFYDRMMNNGAVVDFLNVGIGQLRTGIFNIADVAIMAGMAILIFHRPSRARLATASTPGNG